MGRSLLGGQQPPGTSTYTLLSASTAVPLEDDGVFYHVAPDLAIAQVMFMGGITVALVGLLTLAPVFRVSYRRLLAGVSHVGPRLCVAGVALLAAGVAAAGTAFALTGTAKLAVSGWDIPALHDAASDQPLRYTPDCAGTSFKVCVHPAFSGFLDAASAALQPVAAEIAGLPGAPVRAEQVASGSGLRNAQGMRFAGQSADGVYGTPAAYHYDGNNGIAPFLGSPGRTDNASWRAGFQQDFLTAYLSNPATFTPTPAQQAVITALMAAAGSPAPLFGQADHSSGQPIGATPTQIAAAAARFQALTPAARHAWLAANLAPLRTGRITLAQVP